jgi:mRNA interferase MazF
VVPQTSQVAHVHISEALVLLNGEPRKAMADQLATVSKERIGSRIGILTPTDLVAVERVVAIQLGFSRER